MKHSGYAIQMPDGKWDVYYDEDSQYVNDSYAGSHAKKPKWAKAVDRYYHEGLIHHPELAIKKAQRAK